MASRPALPSASSTATAGIAHNSGRRRHWGKRRTNGGRPGETLAAYLFLAPYLFVLAIFFIFASLYGIGLSFFQVDIGFTTPQFVGWHYYLLLFQQLSDISNSDFWTSMINIVRFTVVVVTGQTILALILAMLLHHTPFFKGFFRTIFYLPAVTSSVAISLIFLWLYAPQGAINYLLSLAHISGPQWLEDPTYALPAIMLLNIWTTAATYSVFFLAALQDIPQELIEAAKVDGAGSFRAFYYVTIPLLRPAIFLIVALGTIASFQMFDQAKFMTNGGPLNSTLTPLLEIYNKALVDNQFGYAAAMSVILFVLIFIVTIVQRRIIDPGKQS